MGRSDDDLERQECERLTEVNEQDDPADPKNWPDRKRWTATLLVACFTFISPLASTMIAPSLDTIADDFNITKDAEKALVMTIFLLAYAIGPFLIGPLSEI